MILQDIVYTLGKLIIDLYNDVIDKLQWQILFTPHYLVCPSSREIESKTLTFVYLNCIKLMSGICPEVKKGIRILL